MSNMVLDLSKSSTIDFTPSPPPPVLSVPQQPQYPVIHYWNDALQEQLTANLPPSPPSDVPCDSSSYSGSNEYQKDIGTNDGLTRKRRYSNNSGTGSATHTGTGNHKDHSNNSGTSSATHTGTGNIEDEEYRKYLMQRHKNNLSAKRSRDAKREREAKVQAKVIFLESENARLKEYLNLFSSYRPVYISAKK